MTAKTNSFNGCQNKTIMETKRQQKKNAHTHINALSFIYREEATLCKYNRTTPDFTFNI